LLALSLLVLTVLPGAVLVFSYERHAGPLAGDPNERTLRFVAGVGDLPNVALDAHRISRL